MEKILLIDGNNLLYRSVTRQSQQQLTDPHGNDITGTFGTLRSVKKLVCQFDPVAVCICWDSGCSERRKKLSSNYKKREEPDENTKRFLKDLKRQLNETYEILKYFPVIQLKNFSKSTEADDLIAAVSIFEDKYDVIIVSSDKDFLQLIDKRIKVYSPIKDVLVGLDNFYEYFKVKREYFLEYMVLTGDPGDGIEGISKIGHKTATSLLEKYGDIVSMMEHRDDLKKSSRLNNIILEEYKLSLNVELIDLKLAACEIYSDYKRLLTEYQSPEKVDVSEFTKKCMHYGFISILTSIRMWANDFDRLRNSLCH